MIESIFFPRSGQSVDQSPAFRKYSIQPLETVSGDFRRSFPAFSKLHDITLSGGYHTTHTMVDNISLLVLPVSGMLSIDLGNESYDLQAGQLAIIHPGSPGPVTISNPLESELVNYIEIWFTSDLKPHIGCTVYSFNPEKKNELENINPGIGYSISIGNFQGRKSGELKIRPGGATFIYVIHGVFEFASRLMEAGDGMGLYGSLQTLDFEALAEESILMALYTS